MKPLFGKAATRAPKAASRRARRAPGPGHAQAHHGQAHHQVQAQQQRVEQRGHRGAPAKAQQQGRQGEVQHEAVEPRHGLGRQQLAAGGPPAQQDQGEEGVVTERMALTAALG
jgi:hypothetical protein